MVAPVLGVLSKSDYGDVVSVVLDASDATILASAEVLRDAGARVRWYHRFFCPLLFWVGNGNVVLDGGRGTIERRKSHQQMRPIQFFCSYTEMYQPGLKCIARCDRGDLARRRTTTVHLRAKWERCV